MLQYLIARDTMRQNQVMAAPEELGGSVGEFPIPNTYTQAGKFPVQPCLSNFHAAGNVPAPAPIEMRIHQQQGEFVSESRVPLEPEPDLGKPKPNSGARVEQI